MNSYEAKQEARRERLERAAARAAADSDAAYQGARAATAGIEFGQPILVGHHSEGRHRAAIRRSDAKMRKAGELDKQARELARRAESVGSGGISSDDPDAVSKLTDKRTELEQERDRMKAANAAWRKRDDAALVATTGKGLEHWTVEMSRRYTWEQKPYPSYALTNIGARIKQAAKRTEHIEAVAQLEATREEIGTAVLTVDPDDNRVTITFPERLSKDDYKAMRSAGFLWSPTRGGFTRKITGSALYHARALATRIGGA